MTDVIEIYEVHEITMDERGAHAGTVGWFSSEAKASASIPEKDFLKRVAAHDAIVVGGKCYRVASTHPIDLDGIKALEQELLRKQALDKLNPEEIKALGLDNQDA